MLAVSSDPLIWAQHPNPDRWQREVFRTFFDGALASGGAFMIRSKARGNAIGSSRFYDHDAAASEIKIGYQCIWDQNPARRNSQYIRYHYRRHS